MTKRPLCCYILYILSVFECELLTWCDRYESLETFEFVLGFCATVFVDIFDYPCEDRLFYFVVNFLECHVDDLGAIVW
jgi:hypothetical protein